MGLEGVELIMAVEEKFKIAISDSDAAESLTVGKFVDVVYSHLRQDARDPCPSQQGFYLVRRQFMSQLELPRSAVRPDTLLESVVPRPHRRTTWRQLVRALTDEKGDGPSLVRTEWLNGLVLFALPAAAFLLTLKLVGRDLFWLGFFPALGVLLMGNRLTAPFKTEFPSKCSRIRDLVRHVKTLDSKTWSKEEVLDQVRAISVQILGVKPEQVTLEARWVDDLGVG